MSVVMVYMTARDMEEARRIGRMLVESRLAACANLIDNMASLYWWDGQIQEETEAVLICKTRMDLVSRLVEAVKAAHSYEVPCITAVPVLKGNPDFLRWVEEETGEES
jgi:periplasmic divalent cation tolerance protein